MLPLLQSRNTEFINRFKTNFYRRKNYEWTNKFCYCNKTIINHANTCFTNLMQHTKQKQERSSTLNRKLSRFQVLSMWSVNIYLIIKRVLKFLSPLTTLIYPSVRAGMSSLYKPTQSLCKTRDKCVGVTTKKLVLLMYSVR